MSIPQSSTSQTNSLPQKMEPAAVGWLVTNVLNKLSDDLVAMYVASTELGLNAKKIHKDLIFMEGLLHEAQNWPVTNPGLQRLVPELIAKADKAEDALDELHYFIIQDQLDGTRHAVPDLDNGLCGHARHSLHVARYITGNFLNCLPCLPMQGDGDDGDAVANITQNATNPGIRNGSPVHMLTLNRVNLSWKIKSAIEDMHSLCEPVFKLLSIIPPHVSTETYNLNRPPTGSLIVQDTLYGRRDIFENTIDDITSGRYCCGTISVLPVVGPGGIGKTTFVQHLYNDKRIEDYFTVKVWVCVSTGYFHVLKLSQEILGCLEGNNNANQATNLAQLQTSIAQRLKSERFLIVFDDIWECDSQSWGNMLAPFSSRNGEAKGNMVLVTTRLPCIAEIVKTTNPIALKGLEPDVFFTFFEAFVFDGKKPGDYQPDLPAIARDIAKKLKGSPLAAHTVGRLLKKKFSREQWMRVLDNNEWQKQKNNEDIMPCLRISYDNLPFDLKKCFIYLSLFPEDYKFENLKITNFWIAQGIINKDDDYMEKLVDYGFLVKNDKHYVMHDLLHELSQSVSSQKCANISSGLSFCADGIPTSISHLSITMEDRYDEAFRSEMAKLKSRINIRNLRTLMIFREYQEQIFGILNETFEEIEGLRVLFIVMNSPESLPKGFSKLIHLRYLRIISPYGLEEMRLPSTLPIFYHLIFLDLLDWHGSDILPKHINRLVNLCHFIASRDLHSNVPEVGKMEHLQELKEFHVKKESVGFELEELGKLKKLGGDLNICNLEKVVTIEDANKANLALKSKLKSLGLTWGYRHSAAGVDVVDALQPHGNLRELSITDESGITGPPSWLYHDITIKLLESLTLWGVSWGTLPSLGQLSYLTELVLQSVSRVHIIGPDFSFMQLKKVEFNDMRDLKEWVVGPDCHSFPMLTSIKCNRCPNFCKMPFWLGVLVLCTEDKHYPTLSTFEIEKCPELSLPPMPRTSTLTYVCIQGENLWELNGGTPGMTYMKNRLTLCKYGGALAFHNMGKLESIESYGVTEMQWTKLQKVTTLREVDVRNDLRIRSIGFLSNSTSLSSLELVNCMNLTAKGFNPVITVNLKKLVVRNDIKRATRSAAEDLLSELVVAKTKLLLPADTFHKLKELEVDSITSVLVAPICSLLAASLCKLCFRCDDRRVESFTEEEEHAFQLLTSLQVLLIWTCPGLACLPNSLHTLSSLRELDVLGCPKISSMPKGGLPTSLINLTITACSPELTEQAKKLQEINPDWKVSTWLAPDRSLTQRLVGTSTSAT